MQDRSAVLVFAKGRAALEALAVGCAVVLCDAAGCGPLVTAADFDRLRPQNFGFRTLTEPVLTEGLLAQIERYDPEDAARVRFGPRCQHDATVVLGRPLGITKRILMPLWGTRPDEKGGGLGYPGRLDPPGPRPFLAPVPPSPQTNLA